MSQGEQLFADHQGLIERVATSDAITQEEFLGTFDIYDPNADTASLGVYLLVRRPYLFLLRRPLREWMRALGELPQTNWFLRQVYGEHFSVSLNYTRASAKDALIRIPDLHEMMMRACLMLKGFAGARHWEKIARGHMIGGDTAIANVILHHLREGPIGDIKLLLSGPDDGFDGRPLITALSPDHLRAAAMVCAARAPELWLYRNWRFGLTDEWREIVSRNIYLAGNYWLLPVQKQELVDSKVFLPPTARQLFRVAWGI